MKYVVDSKKNIIQNEKIAPTNPLPHQLSTTLEAFELVFKRDFIELIFVN